MFGRKKEEPRQQGRYYAQTFQTSLSGLVKSYDTELQEALNAGSAKGWRLISAAGYGGNTNTGVTLFWDTSSE